MSRNFLTIGGIGAAGALGYYFYIAGGDPQQAQKQFKNDVASLQHKVPDERKSAQDIGARIDEGIQNAKDQGKKAEQSLNSYSKDAQNRLEDARKSTGRELMKGVDKFDKTVEEGASKAKSGISSWFGGNS